MDGEDVWVKVELEPDNWKPDVLFFFSFAEGEQLSIPSSEMTQLWMKLKDFTCVSSYSNGYSNRSVEVMQPKMMLVNINSIYICKT